MAVADHWFSSNPPTRDTGGLAANGIAGATPLVGDDDVYMICCFLLTVLVLVPYLRTPVS